LPRLVVRLGHGQHRGLRGDVPARGHELGRDVHDVDIEQAGDVLDGATGDKTTTHRPAGYRRLATGGATWARLLVGSAEGA